MCLKEILTNVLYKKPKRFTAFVLRKKLYVHVTIPCCYKLDRIWSECLDADMTSVTTDIEICYFQTLADRFVKEMNTILEGKEKNNFNFSHNWFPCFSSYSQVCQFFHTDANGNFLFL